MDKEIFLCNNLILVKILLVIHTGIICEEYLKYNIFKITFMQFQIKCLIFFLFCMILNWYVIGT